MSYILHIYYTYIIHITYVYIYMYIYIYIYVYTHIYIMAMTLHVSRVTFCLDMSLYWQLQSVACSVMCCYVLKFYSGWCFTFEQISCCIYILILFLPLPTLHYQVFRVWGEVNLIRLGNLPVKFEWFLPDWHHFIFNRIEGIIFPYISNLTFVGGYDRGFFIDTYIVWIMVLGWW